MQPGERGTTEIAVIPGANLMTELCLASGGHSFGRRDQVRHPVCLARVEHGRRQCLQSFMRKMCSRTGGPKAREVSQDEGGSRKFSFPTVDLQQWL